MDTPSDELNQLHAGDVFLPPQIFLDLGTEARHEVVEIHDNMNTNVEEHEECGMSAAHKPICDMLCYQQGCCPGFVVKKYNI